MRFAGLALAAWILSASAFAGAIRIGASMQEGPAIHIPAETGPPAPVDAVILDAPAYTRTVTASSYTLTGTSVGSEGTDPNVAFTSLLLKMGGRDGAAATTDTSPSPKAVTFVDGAQIDTAIKKSGATGLLLDGTGDYIRVADSADFAFGSGDFTIEAWVYPTSAPALNKFNTIISHRFSFGTDNAFALAWGDVGTGDKLFFTFTSNGTTDIRQTPDPDWNPTINEWHHLAVTRSGTTLTIYADGVSLRSYDIGTVALHDSGQLLKVGTGTLSANEEWPGSIDDVRIYKGYAAYTGSTYTLPTEPLPVEVTWSASPSSTTGSCTGTDTFSCVVTVTPDATGEGVETITVTRGAASDTETLGFYVAGAHSVFLSQDVDGDYNSTLANLDAVATWQNVGTSALDVTQATGTAQPTFRTSVVGGQPVVSCDGGDRISHGTAASWLFIGDGTGATAEATWSQTTTAGSFYAVMGTGRVNSAGRGFAIANNDNSANETHRNYTWNAAGTATLTTSSPNALPADALSHTAVQTLIDAGGVDTTQWTNGYITASTEQTFSSTNPTTGLALCASNGGTLDLFPVTGYIFSARVYASKLTATQMGINKAVDEWALGGTLPAYVNGTANSGTWYFVGDSITAGALAVTNWPTKLTTIVSDSTVDYFNIASSGDAAPAIVAQFSNFTPPYPKYLFALGGINSIKDDVTGADTYAILAPMYAEAQSNDVIVVALLTPPFGNAAIWTSGRQTQLEALNALIAADGNVDIVIDLYDLMGEPGTPEDLAAIYDGGDGLHPSEAGTQFIADTVATALGL